MRNESIIRVCEDCRKHAIHPGESSDYARGIRDVVESLAEMAMTQSHTTATKLYRIGDGCR